MDHYRDMELEHHIRHLEPKDVFVNKISGKYVTDLDALRRDADKAVEFSDDIAKISGLKIEYETPYYNQSWNPLGALVEGVAYAASGLINLTKPKDKFVAMSNDDARLPIASALIGCANALDNNVFKELGIQQKSLDRKDIYLAEIHETILHDIGFGNTSDTVRYEDMDKIAYRVHRARAGDFSFVLRNSDDDELILVKLKLGSIVDVEDGWMGKYGSFKGEKYWLRFGSTEEFVKAMKSLSHSIRSSKTNP
eukprot:TRINITY_DN777997_c0_g1_i1.p1 TRINITY_DN777997_c0_g1~~TRINITY_DN777997_c0_g1_i1.p1  ORF type:complete len:252 (+),score=55.22 TRINITY_DN777997_c0_g1_i1:154-909(+)